MWETPVHTQVAKFVRSFTIQWLFNSLKWHKFVWEYRQLDYISFAKNGSCSLSHTSAVWQSDDVIYCLLFIAIAGPCVHSMLYMKNEIWKIRMGLTPSSNYISKNSSKYEGLICSISIKYEDILIQIRSNTAFTDVFIETTNIQISKMEFQVTAMKFATTVFFRFSHFI